MKKWAKILIGCIAAVVVFVIGSTVYVSGRLPEEIKIKKRRAAQNKELRRKRT